MSRCARQCRAGLLLAVGAVLACVAAAESGEAWPPPPSGLPYCNPDPAPIPPLSEADMALNPKLELVNVFVRHGDRTIAQANICWPNDAMDWDCELRQLQHTSLTSDKTSATLGRVYRLQYMPGREEERGDCGVGQLTAVGYNQHLINGGHLRDAYVTRAGLLPETYETDPGLFFLRADNSRRTQMSGQALFSGLYPESESSTDTPLFPFYTRDETVDDILPNSANCPLLTEAYEAVIKSSYYPAFEAKVKALLTEVNGLLGTSYTDIGGLWDCMHVHICHKFPLPEVLTEDIFQRTVNLTFFETTFPYFYNNTRIGRLGMGPLIAEMYGNMKSIRNGTADPVRFWLYSGHDTGPIMPMLAAYHAPLKVWCPYASMITVEMYSADTPSGNAVRFVYNGEAITLPGCDGMELCDFDKFAALTEGIIPSPAECGLV